MQCQLACGQLTVQAQRTRTWAEMLTMATVRGQALMTMMSGIKIIRTIGKTRAGLFTSPATDPRLNDQVV